VSVEALWLPAGGSHPVVVVGVRAPTAESASTMFLAFRQDDSHQAVWLPASEVSFQRS
jgi:hypothetical protein